MSVVMIMVNIWQHLKETTNQKSEHMQKKDGVNQCF